MRLIEGRGYLVRCALDTPFMGWIGARQLDTLLPFGSAPWMALRALSELTLLFPGGLALLWDLPQSSLAHLHPEARAGFWSALGHVPGLTLHIRDEAFADLMGGPANTWFHAAQPPTGPMGQAWRQGWIGWVPENGPGWSLPDLGRAEEVPGAPGEIVAGGHWGELVLPLGVLGSLTGEDLAPLLGDLQAGLERNLSMRLSARAWPDAFPFLRRRTGWRIGVLGGREHQSASGSWDDVAKRLGDLAAGIAGRLKCPVQIGPCRDPELASALGHQAMREGLPWRYSLALPPASPTFTPGLAADPREAAPLASRAFYPGSLAPVLAHPPVALLRLPNMPQEASAAAFLRGLDPPPAVRWIPPDVPPPGPFMQERPWAAASAFPPLADVTQALQPALFDDLEPDGD